ncbi:MAG: PHP domain-containing protein [Oscillospiraceae bacterium]|nr:PHP domain-containing protein [Oscillospiraceae bacterium]
MKIKQDWHIHTEYSCDSACLNMDDLIVEAESLGIEEFGVTDHLHTIVNRPDMINSRKHYDAIIAKNPALKEKFHFGIEISCVSEWELDLIHKGEHQDAVYGLRNGGPANAKPALDLECVKDLGIAFVNAGVHWPLYCEIEKDALINDYHRQYMFLAQHKDVDILAHYLWWHTRQDIDNPFANFGNIPASMKQELAFALKENNCAFELNICAIILAGLSEKFVSDYLEYACGLQSMGVKLAIGGDCHSKHYTDIDYARASKILEAAGIDFEKNIFRFSK